MQSTSHTVCKLQVHFYAAEEGTFDAVLELFTAGGAISHLSVTAAVVAPSLALTPNLLDLEVTHLGIPQERRLTLSNLTMLPTSFSWEAYGSGEDEVGGGQLGVTIDPPQGVIEPGQLLLCIAAGMIQDNSVNDLICTTQPAIID